MAFEAEMKLNKSNPMDHSVIVSGRAGALFDRTAASGLGIQDFSPLKEHSKQVEE